MEKIKKVLFMVAIIVALVMSSCAHKHKNYIPADSKVVGKLDIKEFFSQSGIEKEKLMEDLSEAFADEMDKISIEDCGLDLTEPVYFFANLRGDKISGGAIIKVEDSKMAKDWIEDNFKTEFDSEGDFDLIAKHDQAIGINDDVLVCLFIDGSDSDAKRALKKVMRQDSSGKLGDNEVFKKMEDSNGFACLYADMSIIPSELVSSRDMSRKLKSKISDFRKMTLGVDASYKDEICDFNLSVSTDDEKAQKQIDKTQKIFDKISDKAVGMLSKESFFGLLTNIKGSACADFVEELSEAFGDSAPKEVLELIEKIDGDFVMCGEDPSSIPFLPRSYGSKMGDLYFVIESKDVSDEIVDFFGGVSDNDSVGVDDDYYPYYSRPSLKETSNGYCYNNNFWFGYDNNAMWFANTDMELVPFKDASNPIPATLADFIKDHSFVCYFNVWGVKKLKSEMSSSDKRLLEAFSEFFDKTKYITISSNG